MAESIFKRIFPFKTRTKLLVIFALMFAGLFYLNSMIVKQSTAISSFVEDQNIIIDHHAQLSDTVSCFGNIKYWFAFLDNKLSIGEGVASKGESAEDELRCPMGDFKAYIEKLKSFASADAVEISEGTDKIQSVPANALGAYIDGDIEGGREIMKEAYRQIDLIDTKLSAIKTDLNRASDQTVKRARTQSTEFRKFPLVFLAFGFLGIALVSGIIFFNIFKPIENITSTMIEASKDPQNTREYMIDENRNDEVGEVISALNSLLEQVSVGIGRIKAAEREISETARRLDAVFNSVADGLITINADGTIESFNNSAYKIFGYTEESARGKKITDLFPESFSKEYMDGIRNFISRGSRELVGSEPKEIMGSRPDHGEFPIELSVNQIALDEDHYIFVNVIRDITYRKELERQLLQSQKMEALGSLSSGIAHEINTPTQYVRDNLKFLRDAFAGFDTLYQALQEIKKSKEDTLASIQEKIVKIEQEQDLDFYSKEITPAIDQSLEGVGHISEIVGAVKGFSYPATDEKMYINLNDALKSTIVVTRNQWKNIARMETAFDESLPPIPCIPGKLTQTILNLIVNAAHAIEEKKDNDPEKNWIRISTSATNKKVIIKVQDSGPGIPKENMTKIFNPFFTTKEVGKGTGQGLSISYDIIVNKHGGALRAESPPGAGASFIIELPIDIENANKQPSAKRV